MGRGPARVAALQAGLVAVPDQIAQVIVDHHNRIAAIAEAEVARRAYQFADGGPSIAAALFGAVKVKGCTPDHGIAIPVEEFHHYNSQKAGHPLMPLVRPI